MKIRYNIYIDDYTINTLKRISKKHSPFKPTVSAIIVEAINQYIKQEAEHDYTRNLVREANERVCEKTGEI